MAYEENKEKGNSAGNNESNFIFIGSKPIINYLKSVNIQLAKSPEIVIKARGKFITKAIDVAEVSRRQSHGGNAVSYTHLTLPTTPYV